MTNISIISDGFFCSITIRDGEDYIGVPGTNNPWRTLFKALLKMKLLRFRKKLKYKLHITHN